MEVPSHPGIRDVSHSPVPSDGNDRDGGSTRMTRYVIRDSKGPEDSTGPLLTLSEAVSVKRRVGTCLSLDKRIDRSSQGVLRLVVPDS